MTQMPDVLNYRALGILSETIGGALGATHDVTRAIRRARDTGRKVDFFSARMAFDGLPSWQRRIIGAAAQVRAREAIVRKSARDWRDLPLKPII
jgi:hypothetical protein